MARILREDNPQFEAQVQVAIIGAGAAGLVAALACHEAGAKPVLFERDSLPRGSTALSAGLIPAPGSRWQKSAGIADGPEKFLADVEAKTKGLAEKNVAARVAAEAAPTLEWLADRYGIPFTLIGDVDFPGHSHRRLHGLPSRSGAELIDRLRQAVQNADIDILCNAHIETLIADRDNSVVGVLATRPCGTQERIGCNALILACNGYGGNPALVAQHIPSLKNAIYFGHVGNQGDAVLWGQELGAALSCMSGHQGHGSVAYPHGILITWVTMMEGGFQVNTRGERFSDESLGYSEQAALVLAQPGGVAWSIFDERIAVLSRQFEDFRSAEKQGAVISALSLSELAEKLSLPSASFAATLARIEAARAALKADEFGRDWTLKPPLAAPFHAVRVTGALFHTQGGLAIDDQARVIRESGTAIENLFAVGGAAVGISGPHASGYLSGNGLMTATALGRIAGRQAALVSARRR